jgi:hypothetical protein
VGNRPAVAKRAEDAEHASGSDRGEEISEVDAEDGALAGVPPRVADHRATARKALRGLVDGNMIEDLVQDPPLDLLEASLRGFQDARDAAPARDDPVAVVPELLVCHAALETPHVGQPGELPAAQLQHVGERRDGVDRGDRPAVLQPDPGIAAELASEQANDPRRLPLAGPG